MLSHTKPCHIIEHNIILIASHFNSDIICYLLFSFLIYFVTSYHVIFRHMIEGRIKIVSCSVLVCRTIHHFKD